MCIKETPVSTCDFLPFSHLLEVNIGFMGKDNIGKENVDLAHGKNSNFSFNLLLSIFYNEENTK